MATPAPLAPKLEASLLRPDLQPEEARARLERWISLGIRRVVATPALLGDLAPPTYPTLTFAGAVSFPAGTSTLACKRMELLECLRLGAGAATVVLTPSLVAARRAGDLEKELRALAATAPELELRVVVEAATLPEEALVVLLRVLKTARPPYLVTGTGVYGDAAGPRTLRWLRDRLTAKVRLESGGSAASAAEAAALLEAGADRVLTEVPERVLGGAP